VDITKNSYHFIISGDSISKGVVLDEKRKKYIVLKNNYVSILQQRINGVAFNLSKFGATLTYGVNKLKGILAKQKADVVLIEYGGNDCDFNWDEVANTPEENHSPRTDLTTFEQTLRDIVNYIKAKDIIPVLMTLPPLNADLYLKWISNNNPIKEKNILKWLGSITKMYWWQERYNAVILKVAEETHTKWIDIRRAFLLQPDFSKFLCSDGIHPNEAGQKLIAEKILEDIRNNASYLIKAETDKTKICLP